jgi:hypothetical protein
MRPFGPMPETMEAPVGEGGARGSSMGSGGGDGVSGGGNDDDGLDRRSPAMKVWM